MSDAPRPFGITVCGIEELAGHGAAGASHVLSILDPDHPVPEAFGGFGEHEKLELRFHDIIDETPGLLAPQPGHVEAILALGRDLLAEPARPAHLLVHCHAGISRSTASMVLILPRRCRTSRRVRSCSGCIPFARRPGPTCGSSRPATPCSGGTERWWRPRTPCRTLAATMSWERSHTP